LRGHSTERKLVEDQLRFAKPIDATASERLNWACDAANSIDREAA